MRRYVPNNSNSYFALRSLARCLRLVINVGPKCLVHGLFRVEIRITCQQKKGRNSNICIRGQEFSLLQLFLFWPHKGSREKRVTTSLTWHKSGLLTLHLTTFLNVDRPQPQRPSKMNATHTIARMATMSTLTSLHATVNMVTTTTVPAQHQHNMRGLTPMDNASVGSWDHDCEEVTKRGVNLVIRGQQRGKGVIQICSSSPLGCSTSDNLAL